MQLIDLPQYAPTVMMFEMGLHQQTMHLPGKVKIMQHGHKTPTLGIVTKCNDTASSKSLTILYLQC